MELKTRPQQAPYDDTLPLRNTYIMAHVVTPADLPRVIEILADSFCADPVWSWAFPQPQQRILQLTQWWGLLLQGAQLNPESMWIADTGDAASVWYPPGVVEFTPELEAKVEPLFERLVGSDQATKIMELMHGFESHRPMETPHYYLSLIGTSIDSRGQGIGLGLLKQNLAWVDTYEMPAYLEASNPGNIALYERYGFEVKEEFTITDGPTITTMWRPAREQENRA